MSETADLPNFDKLWDYSDPAETERRFLEILDQFKADPARHGELLTQIARTRGLQQRFDEANATLDDAAALIGDAPSVPHVRLLLERGRTLRSAGSPKESIPAFEQAWSMARDIGDAYNATDAAHMLAIAEEPERALEWFEKGLESATAAADSRTRGWIGPLQNNIAWTYHDLGKYEQALDYFKRNVELHERIHEETGRNRTPLEIARWSVGRALRSLGRIDEALAIQRTVLREADGRGRTDTGYIHEEIAECLQAQGLVEEAREHFATAYEKLSGEAWLQAQEPARLQRLKELGDVAS